MSAVTYRLVWANRHGEKFPMGDPMTREKAMALFDFNRPLRLAACHGRGRLSVMSDAEYHRLTRARS